MELSAACFFCKVCTSICLVETGLEMYRCYGGELQRLTSGRWGRATEADIWEVGESSRG